MPEYLIFPHITALDDGLDVGAGLAESLAELLYICVNGAVVTYEILPPDCVEDLVTCEDLLLVLDEIQKKIVFPGRDIQSDTVHAYDVLKRLDYEFIYDDAAVLYEKALVALYKGIYLNEQELGREGLGDVFVRADLIAADYVALGAKRGQEDDRDIISGPYEFADFNAVFSGHHDVQDYYVVTVMHNKAAGFDTVSRLVNVKAVLYKKSRDDVP